MDLVVELVSHVQIQHRDDADLGEETFKSRVFKGLTILGKLAMVSTLILLNNYDAKRKQGTPDI